MEFLFAHCCANRVKRCPLVAGRVVNQGNVHLAVRLLFPSAGRNSLDDSVVRAVVFVGRKGSATQCRPTRRGYQRLSGHVMTTHDTYMRQVVGYWLAAVLFHVL